MQLKIIIMLIFALIVVMFAIVNIEAVTVDFYFLEAEVELAFLIIFSILFGALFVYVFSANKQIKLSKKIKQLEKENKKINQELDKLNTKLVEDSNKANEQNNIEGTKAEL